MSNQAVGNVYQTIINDVIETSRVDFEEGGVDEAVLEELKQGWQRKLSQLNVASFPWDPKPDPNAVNHAAPAAAPPASQQQNVANYAQAQLSPPPNTQSLPHMMVPPPAANQNGNAPTIKTEPGLAKNDPIIKQEPGLHNGLPPAYAPPPVRGGAQVPLAAQRAAQALEGQFGPRAAASINAIHTGMSQAAPMNPGPGQAQQGPRPSGTAPPNVTPQQYRQQVANAAAIQQQRAQQQAGQARGQNGVGGSQMDGPADAFDGVLMQRNADGKAVELGRVEIDNMLHEQIAAQAKRMEGGGLMLPLREAAKHNSLPARKKRHDGGVAQLDGGLDDEIKDEDFDDEAINSDLDDPDDDLEDDEEDDEAMGHIMLCMYDKVQRVKNKWKCTLKDGVLTVNGKEYVFHKATGEYEW